VIFRNAWDGVWPTGLRSFSAEMIDVAYQLKADEWRNRRRVQMVMKDFRKSNFDRTI